MFLIKKAAGFFSVAFFILCFPLNLSAQNNMKSFLKLSCPEKKWVVFHIFKAKGAYNISLDVTNKTKELINDTTLDGDINGGQLDAFRHCYWMAKITQKYGWRTARSLGKSHEKGNYIDYKKHRTEEGTFPDAQACQMDYLNNDAGIELGKNSAGLNDEEIILKIKEMILSGKLYVIKKDKAGNYLTCSGELITEEELKGKWETPKCVLPSFQKQ